MVKRTIKYFVVTFFIISMLFTINIFASTNNDNAITFSRKNVAMNKLFTITFNKVLVAKQGAQTIQDIQKLITCTEDDNGKTIPIRASYQVGTETTKLNIQISDENGQPQGKLGGDYTLTINKGIKAVDGTLTDKTYVQPFTINAPEAVDDNVRLMLNDDYWFTHIKGYAGLDWTGYYPSCSQILMNDGTMLTNVQIDYVNGHKSGDAVAQGDIADSGKITDLKNLGTYTYYGYPVINGVEDRKRLFKFIFTISRNTHVKHVDSKIIMGCSELPSMLDMKPLEITVAVVPNGYEQISPTWENPVMDENGKVLEDNVIYENRGYTASGDKCPFIYYYVANPPNDTEEFTKGIKKLNQEQINYLKDMQSIIGGHWKCDQSNDLILYSNTVNKDSIYSPWAIGFGTAFNLQTNKSNLYVVNMNNILGNISFSDFQKVRDDAIGLLDKNIMSVSTNNITELDTQIENSFYPLNNATNVALQQKQFAWIESYQKQLGGVMIKSLANTTSEGKIESNYYLSNGK